MDPIILNLPVPLDIANLLQSALYAYARFQGPNTFEGERCFHLGDKLGELIWEAQKKLAQQNLPTKTAGMAVSERGL